MCHIKLAMGNRKGIESTVCGMPVQHVVLDVFGHLVRRLEESSFRLPPVTCSSSRVADAERCIDLMLLE